MDESEIDYKTLRRIQQQEQNSPIMTKIDMHFYEYLSTYLKNLDEIAKKEENEQKNKLVLDEIKNTKKIVTSIYEQREKKIVQAALSTTRGGKPDIKNMLEKEKSLYDSLVELVMQTRSNILNNKTKQSKKEESQVQPKTPENKENTNPIVRVTTDIPEFMGTDMKKYSLKKDDVLSLLKEMTEPLKKRDVINQIK